MTAFNVIMRILAAIAIIATAVFVVIVFGDKIVSFFKKLLGRVSFHRCDESDFVDDSDLEEDEVVAAEQDFEG